MINLVKPNYKRFPIDKLVYLFFGKAIPITILFLITILYARKLTYEDYGRFQSLWMYTNILNIVISFGLTSLVLSSNLLSLAAFIKQKQVVIITAYIVLAAVTTILFILYGRNLSITTKGLLMGFVIIQSACSVSETLLLKSHRERLVLVINFIYSLLFFAWHYYVLSGDFDLDKIITGITIISLARLVFMVLVKRRDTFVATAADHPLSYKHWIYLGVNDVTGVLSRWLDKLLLVYLLTAADFAVFFNGSFEIPFFGLLVSVIGSIMLIEISGNTTARDKVQQLFRESFRILSLVVFPLFMFFLFFRHDLFGVIFQHKYDASIPVFLISIFLLPVRINNYSNILQYYQLGNKIVLGSLLDIGLAIGLMIVLYPLWGTRGVALAVVVATYCQSLYYLHQSALVLHTSIRSLVPAKTLSIIFMIMILTFSCLFYLLSDFDSKTRLIIASIATMVIILVNLLIYFRKNNSPRA